MTAAHPPRPRPRRRLRRAAFVVLLLLVVLAIVAFFVASAGSFKTYPRAGLTNPALQRAAPAWTRPCDRSAPYVPADQTTCAHVHGRVVWIQHHDPDGDGDRHLLVLAHRRIHIVKVPISLRVAHLPGVGTNIDAVGFVLRGASGHDEIDAVRLVPGGPTGT
ncbi:hypothetical protein FSW04_02990 [Baekduia soli]|uniref:Uncharacterized protein n=1 Tax=Baekduia soli TaxID=496014 RepID=A0A5B8U0Y0_9ACTN|nr:hypothetical protein [Baekduia soli]QEC46648.1 hypothetical protein FSW04_02990 [Baekduia soli]